MRGLRWIGSRRFETSRGAGAEGGAPRGALVLVAGVAVGLASCTLDTGGIAQPGFGTGGGAQGGTGQGGTGHGGTGQGGTTQGGNGGSVAGGGGAAPECVVETDCPGADNACSARTCNGGVCGLTFAVALSPCNFNGGQVCDGAGNCLVAIGGFCATTSQCQAGTCVDGVCCESTCDGACERCDGAKAGNCALTVGADPDDDCGNGVCDTAGGCAFGAVSWARSYGNSGADDDEAYAVTVDRSNNNVIVVGYYSGTIRFGGATDLTSAGSADVFVAKLDENGGLIWQKSFGSAINQWAGTVATDSNSNIIVAGTFGGTLTFGGATPMNAAGGTDVFVAKLTSDGNFVWQRSYGDAADQSTAAVAVSATTGDVYLTGTMQGAPNFGAGPFTATGSDVWALALTSGGTFRWAKQFGTTGDQTANSVALDASDNVVLVGSNTGSINFGGVTTHASAGAEDVFVAKLASDGTEVWSQRYGDANAQFANDVAIGPGGSVYLAGSFFGTLDFGDGSPQVAAGAERDVFVTELSSAGVVQWGSSFGDVARQSGFTIDVDASGNVLVAGVNTGSVDFGGGALVSTGSRRGFLAKLGGSGEHLWSKSFGDNVGNTDPWALAVFPNGNVVVAGSFDVGIDFAGAPLTTAGARDVFVARFVR